MFNIESYIAPLILSKVEKFVKNINPNEFKVIFLNTNILQIFIFLSGYFSLLTLIIL